MDAETRPEQIARYDTVLCPRCSEGFGCGARAGGCWCAQVTLDDQVRSDLARFYDGCLCPECLRTLEDARPRRQNVWLFIMASVRRRFGR